MPDPDPYAGSQSEAGSNEADGSDSATDYGDTMQPDSGGGDLGGTDDFGGS